MYCAKWGVLGGWIVFVFSFDIVSASNKLIEGIYLGIILQFTLMSVLDKIAKQQLFLNSKA